MGGNKHALYRFDTRSTAAEEIKELLVVCLTLKGLKNVGQICNILITLLAALNQ